MAQYKRPHRRRVSRTQQLAAQAFRDALRDILADEGVVSLADEADRDTVYHFDGVSWQRETLPRPVRRALSVEVVAAASTGG